MSSSFNRRRDACFLATRSNRKWRLRHEWFQSQTRRLLPRNGDARSQGLSLTWFQSQTRRLLPRNRMMPVPHPPGSFCFNRRRDACFLATPCHEDGESVEQRFNRRRDACFLATGEPAAPSRRRAGFNRRRDACFLATPGFFLCAGRPYCVSIADATLASSQPIWLLLLTFPRLISIADATLASSQQ